MSGGIVVKLFSAAWCSPCKALKPQLAAALGDALKVVDVDKEGCGPYEISALPTVVIERHGRYAAMLLPPVTKERVMRTVAEVAGV